MSIVINQSGRDYLGDHAARPTTKEPGKEPDRRLEVDVDHEHVDASDVRRVEPGVGMWIYVVAHLGSYGGYNTEDLIAASLSFRDAMMQMWQAMQEHSSAWVLVRTPNDELCFSCGPHDMVMKRFPA